MPGPNPLSHQGSPWVQFSCPQHLWAPTVPDTAMGFPQGLFPAWDGQDIAGPWHSGQGKPYHLARCQAPLLVSCRVFWFVLARTLCAPEDQGGCVSFTSVPRFGPARMPDPGGEYILDPTSAHHGGLGGLLGPEASSPASGFCLHRCLPYPTPAWEGRWPLWTPQLPFPCPANLLDPSIQRPPGVG